MRIGVFGGTFDPLHNGHLVLAEQCREQCHLDEVWFVPAAIPPHKQDLAISTAKTRCDMIEFGIAGNPQFKLSRLELDRPGLSYTVTTLERIRDEDPTRELFLLVGADSIRDLPTWRQPDRIQQLATIVAVNRGRAAPTESQRQALQPTVADRIQFVGMPGIDISATDIRQRVFDGRSIRYLVPRAVESYILQQRLYRP